MYDYWCDPAGVILEHWTDGDLLYASAPPVDARTRDVILAQYGAVIPLTFYFSMPIGALEEAGEMVPSVSSLFSRRDFLLYRQCGFFSISARCSAMKARSSGARGSSSSMASIKSRGSAISTKRP